MPAWLFAQVFMGSAQRKLFQTGVPILTYHSIARPAPGAHDPFLCVTPAQFDRQLELLQQAGYMTAALESALRTPGDGKKEIVITFDDGFQNVFQNALEPLDRHRAKAIQFLVAGLIGGRNQWMTEAGDVSERLMDERQIRDWLAAGHEIGSHTLTHPI